MIENSLNIDFTLNPDFIKAPCAIPVDMKEATVCHSIIGSLTAYFNRGTEPRTQSVAKEELLFIIRTGMASGRYESSSVKKVIYVNEVNASPVVASGNESLWSPTTHRSSSTLIAIILSALLMALAGLLTLLFVKRRKTASETFRSHSYFNEEQPHVDNSMPAIPHAGPHAEDVWHKAYNIWRAESNSKEETGTPNINDVATFDSKGYFDDRVFTAKPVEFTERTMPYGAIGNGWTEDFDESNESIDIDHSDYRREESEPEREFNSEFDEESEEGSKSGCNERNADDLEPKFDETVTEKGLCDNKSSFDDKSHDFKCTHDGHRIHDQGEDSTSQVSETNSQNNEIDSGNDSNQLDLDDLLSSTVEQNQPTFDDITESKSPDANDEAYDLTDNDIDGEANERKRNLSENSADEEGVDQITSDTLSSLQQLQEID